MNSLRDIIPVGVSILYAQSCVTGRGHSSRRGIICVVDLILVGHDSRRADSQRNVYVAGMGVVIPWFGFFSCSEPRTSTSSYSVHIHLYIYMYITTY